MSTSFPSSTDTFVNPVATDKTNSPSHSGQHANINDAVAALETKVGVDSSAVTSSLDYKLKSSSSVDPGHLHTGAGTSGATGTGAIVRASTPTLTTPVLGAATATSINGLIVTTTTGTFSLTNGKTLTVTDSTTLGTNAITFGGTEILTLAAAKNVTFADAFVTSGAFSQTFTATGTTTVTLPTSGTLATLAGTETLTNKRHTRRVVATTQSATPTINTDNTDVSYITGLAQAITSMTTNLSGTPVNGDSLIISITDNGTARAITWGASFESSGTVTLPATTVLSTRLDVGFLWNIATSKWRCIATA